MTTASHWISNYQQSPVLFGFLDLSGGLVPVTQQMERLVRPGTNGIGVIYTGKRGEPFQVQTRVDAAHSAAALTILAAYKSVVGTKKDLYYCRTFWGTVLVGNVTLISVEKTATIVGGLNVNSSASGALLTVAWTLETLYAS